MSPSDHANLILDGTHPVLLFNSAKHVVIEVPGVVVCLERRDNGQLYHGSGPTLRLAIKDAIPGPSQL